MNEMLEGIARIKAGVGLGVVEDHPYAHKEGVDQFEMDIRKFGFAVLAHCEEAFVDQRRVHDMSFYVHLSGEKHGLDMYCDDGETIKFTLPQGVYYVTRTQFKAFMDDVVRLRKEHDEAQRLQTVLLNTLNEHDTKQ